jgi:hypothetical protein
MIKNLMNIKEFKMKNYTFILMIIAAFLGSASTFAQSQNTITRSRACTINPGYSMSDVVAISRDFSFNEDSAPNAVFFREPTAYTTNTPPDWDFILVEYYSGYADLVSKRSVQRNRAAARSGITFDDLASCSVTGRISDVYVGNQETTFDDTEATLMTTRRCDLNGETTVQDAVAVAETMGSNLGAYSAVSARRYGGPRIAGESQINMSFVYSDPQDFGTTLDGMKSGSINPNEGLGGGTPMTCEIGTLWVSHRVYAANN